MTKIAQLIRDLPVVDQSGKMDTRFYNWAQQVTRLSIITGSGSPEGVVEAPITTLYMNSSGTSGNILYIKRDSDISGDRTQGWILV